MTHFFDRLLGRAEADRTKSAHSVQGVHVLHLSLGPVQDFITESRRTRDLWAGSFLLSWLSGHAMAAVKEAGGEIKSPAVEDDYLWKAILAARQNKRVTAPVWIGTLPNRFQATVPAHFDPSVCAKAAQNAWRGVADEVWREFVAPALSKLPDATTEAVQSAWERQIGGGDAPPPFWEINWAKGPDPGDRSDLRWLDCVKLTRLSSSSPAQGGQGRLCALIGDMTALAGDLPNGTQFWAALRVQISQALYEASSGRTLELAEDERLCAIALVRRLFPALNPEQRERAIGWDPGRALTETGERVVRFWPSTAHVAAAPWLECAHAIDGRTLEAVQAKIDALSPALGRAERYSAIPSTLAKLHKGAWTDGRVFSVARSDDLYGDIGGDETKGRSAFAVIQQLRETKASTAAGEPCKLGAPSTYYAILSADGDRMGEALSGKKGAAISEALGRFAHDVRIAFADEGDRRIRGTLIYAGADDVLAFTPVDDCLHAALTIRELFRDAMKDCSPSLTISVSIVLTDMRTVLRWALEAGRELLNGWAKTIMRRNALAIRILRAGENEPIWAAQFRESEKECPIHALRRIVEAGQGDNAQTYALRDRVPWIWARADRLTQTIRALQGEIRLDVPAAIPPLPDDQLAGLIRAIAGDRVRDPIYPMDWVIAGRLLRGHSARGASVNEEDLPMNPALLSLLRFFLLHRRPMLQPAAVRLARGAHA